nr:isoform 3 of canalicular multispecific organic anion transporter 2 [Quercus suber]
MKVIFAPVWSPILTFSLYAGLGQQGNSAFDFAKVFTSLSILTLLNSPLTTVIHTLPTLAGSLASFQRVQNHLNGIKREDNRVAFGNQKQDDMMRRLDTGTLAANAADASPVARSNLEYSEESLKKPESEQTSTHSQLADADIIASVQGTFSWTEDSEPLITVPDWSIPRGMFTMVLGPVGCGKSTLLKSLLGELSAFKGSIRTNYSGVAYCDQTVWIPNETVREIIVNGEPFDNSWYQTVIETCALEEDVRNWPKGDETVAGTKGISMSGGQKNRLAIARAIYSKREFLILDDVLSGLDASTERMIFNNLFGENGLARKSKMTTVFASSDGKRVPYADQILLLDDKGHIKGKGRPDELEENFGISVAEAKQTTEDKETTKEKEAKTEKTEEHSAPEDAEKDLSRQRGDSKVYVAYAKAAGRRWLLLCAVSLGAYSFFQVYPSEWSTSLPRLPNEIETQGGFLMSNRRIIEIVIISQSGVHFHDALLDTVARAPMAFHSTVDSGTTTNRFSQDLRLIDMELPNATFGVVTTLLLFIGQIIVAAISSKYIAVMIPFLVGAMYVLQHYYLRTSRQLRLLEIENKAPLYTQFIEALNGIVTIRAFQRESFFEDRNLVTLDASRKAEYMLLSVQCWLNFAIDIIIMLIVIIFVSITTTLRQQIGPSYLGIGLSTILGFNGSAKAFVTYWVLVEVSISAISRINSFIASTDSETSPESTPANLEEMKWPSEGAVELNGLVAQYEPSRNCLDNVTISIKPGQRVAVCGRTGSGSITIDGVDIATLPHEYVRSRLVALPQDTFIFDGTIRLNVDPTQAIADDRLITVLERVQLWSKIQARGGLDAVANDKFFSPGEAQLLVFARAMLRESKVLILDEFTSSLDETTSAIVEELLRSWFKDWTIIVVAHKLDAIADFDKVAVLDDGKLLEYDSPERLMESDSAFRRLRQVAALQ